MSDVQSDRMRKETESGDIQPLVISPLEEGKAGNYYRKWIKENINEMDCQEITITFKDSIEQSTERTIKALVKETIKNIIKSTRARALSRTILISEYSKVGRFHYHGIISGMTKKQIRDIRHTFNIYFGRIEIKPIRYYESYVEYMVKDIEQNEDIDDREYDIIIKQIKKAKI